MFGLVRIGRKDEQYQLAVPYAAYDLAGIGIAGGYLGMKNKQVITTGKQSR
jgi:hypothetical protein